MPMAPEELIKRLKALLKQQRADIEVLRAELNGKEEAVSTTLATIEQWEAAP